MNTREKGYKVTQSNPFAAETVESTPAPAAATAPTFLERHRLSLELAAVPRLVGGRGYDIVLRVEGTYTDRNVLPALQRIADEISAEVGDMQWQRAPMRGSTGLVEKFEPADRA